MSSVAWWRDCSRRRVPAALGLAQLGGRVAVGLREDLARLVAGGVQDLGALPLGLLADARDLGLLLLELHLLLADLLLGAADLLRGRLLGVALDRVGELGGGAHEVQRVHADRVARRLGDGAASARPGARAGGPGATVTWRRKASNASSTLARS